MDLSGLPSVTSLDLSDNVFCAVEGWPWWPSSLSRLVQLREDLETRPEGNTCKCCVVHSLTHCGRREFRIRRKNCQLSYFILSSEREGEYPQLEADLDTVNLCLHMYKSTNTRIYDMTLYVQYRIVYCTLGIVFEDVKVETWPRRLYLFANSRCSQAQI